MSKLKYLNPFSSLFGRIFLWFWMATIMMIVTITWVNRQLNDNFEIEPATHLQVKSLKKFARKINNAASWSFLTKERIQHLIRNPRMVGDKLVILYRPQTKRIIVNRKLPHRMRLSDMLPLALADEISQMSTPTHVFYGGQKVDIAGREFVLLIGRSKLSLSPMQRFQAQDPSIRITIAIIVSGLFCFLLAWSLIKPIRRLQTASQQLASGDTKAQIKKGTERTDELGQLSRDFNSMAERIDQLLGAQKRLLGDISHELRTPLTRMQLAVGLAHECKPEDLPKHLQRIENESMRIDKMIGQVLQLSRLETQPERLNLQKTSLTNLLTQLVDDAQLEAESQQKSVVLEKCSDVIVKLDEQLIASAIENLIRNAIKYTAENTLVSIILSVKDDKAIVEVRDKGPGVPESELKLLFRAFYRVSEARQRQTGGTGLGLAIADRAVKAHGGEIVAKNLPDAGLSVTISLPLEQK